MRYCEHVLLCMCGSVCVVLIIIILPFCNNNNINNNNNENPQLVVQHLGEGGRVGLTNVRISLSP